MPAHSFKDCKYLFVNGILPAHILGFLKVYFDIMKSNNRFFHDAQCPASLSVAGDPGLDAVLEWIRPKVSSLVGLDLAPTYSYARLYSKDEVLHRHTDRAACEISLTTSITIPDGMPPSTLYLKPPQKKEVKVEMWEGDGCIYAGVEVEHWRDPFPSDGYTQLFLHFISKTGKYFPEQLYDKRGHLGSY
jgi:hypothetical protein